MNFPHTCKSRSWVCFNACFSSKTYLRRVEWLGREQLCSMKLLISHRCIPFPKLPEPSYDAFPRWCAADSITYYSSSVWLSSRLRVVQHRKAFVIVTGSRRQQPRSDHTKSLPCLTRSILRPDSAARGHFAAISVRTSYLRTYLHQFGNIHE